AGDAGACLRTRRDRWRAARTPTERAHRSTWPGARRATVRVQVLAEMERPGGTTKRNQIASRKAGAATKGTALALRIVEKLLQTDSQAGRDAIDPGAVDETDIDEIAQMDSILVAERGELHPYERLERQQTKCLRLLGFGDIRHRLDVFGAN